MMSTLKRAIEIATIAHAGQVDKGGRPYIDHPLRVMANVESETAKIVAVLHDVLEDCPTFTLGTFQREGFSEEVLSALLLLTKIPTEKEPYLDYIGRIAKHRLAAKVKLADLYDNSDLTRLGREASELDVKRNQKYIAAICILEAALAE